MIKVNYKSDFKINEKSERVAMEVPFVFSYYVFDNKRYVVSFDGQNYVNCERLDDGSLDVIFNNPDLGIGLLKVERKYAVDDKSFADGVFDIVSVEKAGVFLTSGQTFENYIQTLVVPPYLKGDKGEPMRWETMTDVERGELVRDVAEAIDPEMVMIENEQARIQAERERVAAERERANTFTELKTEMEQTIEGGNVATEAAKKVVEDYDEKVAEQDEKLSELGSEVGEVKRTFYIAEGKTHSSTVDRIFVNGRVGESIMVSVESSNDAANGTICNIYGYKEDGQSKFIQGVNIGQSVIVILDDDYKEIGLYVGSLQVSHTVTFLAKFRISLLTMQAKDKLDRMEYLLDAMVLYGQDLTGVSSKFKGLVRGNTYRIYSPEVMYIPSGIEETRYNYEIYYIDTQGRTKVVAGVFGQNKPLAFYDFTVPSEMDIDKGLYVYARLEKGKQYVVNKVSLTEIADVEKNLSSFVIKGSDNTFVSQRIYRLIPGNTYRAYVPAKWEHQNATSGYLFEIYCYDENNALNVLFASNYSTSQLYPFIDFVIPENLSKEKPYITVGLRADVGEAVSISIVDVTIEKSSYEPKLLHGQIINGCLERDSDGKSIVVPSESHYVTPYLPVRVNDEIEVSGTVNLKEVHIYDGEFNRIGWFQMNSSPRKYATLKEDTHWCRFTYLKDGIGSVKINGSIVWENVTNYTAMSVITEETLPYITEYSDIMALNPIKDVLLKFNSANKKSNNVKPLTIAHFSDLHGIQENLRRFIEFTDYYKEHIDVKLNTGDFVSAWFQSPYQWYYETVGTRDILISLGNHELCDEDLGTNAPTHGGKEAYDKYISPFVQGWGVNQPTNADTDGKCYYYKDFAEQGIRMIVLDIQMYSDAEHNWFSGVLNDALSSNLTVIVASHFTKSAVVPFNCNYTSLQETESVTGDFDSMFCSDPNTAALAADNVNEFIEKGGVFACWIVGHLHWDVIGYLRDYPNQLVIAVENAGLKSNKDADRYVTTKSQDAFEIVSVDTQKKLVKVFKVGNNMDYYLRKKETVCLSFESHNVICES